MMTSCKPKSISEKYLHVIGSAECDSNLHNYKCSHFVQVNLEFNAILWMLSR